MSHHSVPDTLGGTLSHPNREIPPTLPTPSPNPHRHTFLTREDSKDPTVISFQDHWFEEWTDTEVLISRPDQYNRLRRRAVGAKEGFLSTIRPPDVEQVSK